jgi:arylsulfatase A-like enzyme
MPTVVSLCGLDIPKTCAGTDKSSAMFGGTPPNSNAIYCEEYDIKVPAPGKNWDFRWRCVVTDQYKLVVDDSPALDINSAIYLYDLQEDPYELNNLVNNPAYTTTKQALFNRLVQFRDETGDTFPKAPPLAESFYNV